MLIVFFVYYSLNDMALTEVGPVSWPPTNKYVHVVESWREPRQDTLQFKIDPARGGVRRFLLRGGSSRLWTVKTEG